MIANLELLKKIYNEEKTKNKTNIETRTEYLTRNKLGIETLPENRVSYIENCNEEEKVKLLKILEKFKKKTNIEMYNIEKNNNNSTIETKNEFIYRTKSGITLAENRTSYIDTCSEEEKKEILEDIHNNFVNKLSENENLKKLNYTIDNIENLLSIYNKLKVTNKTIESIDEFILRKQLNIILTKNNYLDRDDILEEEKNIAIEITKKSLFDKIEDNTYSSYFDKYEKTNTFI